MLPTKSSLKKINVNPLIISKLEEKEKKFQDEDKLKQNFLRKKLARIIREKNQIHIVDESAQNSAKTSARPKNFLKENMKFENPGSAQNLSRNVPRMRSGRTHSIYSSQSKLPDLSQ